jgi:hypothetical protein
VPPATVDSGSGVGDAELGELMSQLGLTEYVVVEFFVGCRFGVLKRWGRCSIARCTS